ncbi:hypothetical protein EDD11_006838 [Mortierella claussenii]|nr:hypothetical protein EDD11_006838 [Mortierella claussenii]
MAEAAREFRDTFDPEKNSVDRELAGLHRVPANSIQLTVDSLVQRIHTLEKSVTDNMAILPAYDVRICLEAVKAMSERLSTLRVQLVPKPKFTFKSRKALTLHNTPASLSILTVSKPIANAVDESLFMKFENLSNKHLFIGTLLAQQYRHSPSSTEFAMEDDVYLGGVPIAHSIVAPLHSVVVSKDVALTNLTNCTVNLVHEATPLGAIHIRNLKQCTLVIPPVSGSILLHDCEGCVIIGACHQSRMHTSTNMDIYLHVTSEPIIEDCTNMRFAPYPYDHIFPSDSDGQSLSHLQQSVMSPSSSNGRLVRLFDMNKLSPQVNYFDRVKDFNWLRQQKSPNWRVLEQSERRPGIAQMVLAKDDPVMEQQQQHQRESAIA